MPRYTKRSILIDNLLQMIAQGNWTFDSLLAPHAISKLSQPLQQYFKNLTDKERMQQMRSALRYMKYNHLVVEDKQHFLSVTNKAKIRLTRSEIEHIIVPKPKKWDGKWRLVLFEIPESHKTKRDAFSNKLGELGLKPLQRSVFIYPFPCQDEVSKVAEYLGVSKFVTYVNAATLDNEDSLRPRFRTLLK